MPIRLFCLKNEEITTWKWGKSAINRHNYSIVGILPSPLIVTVATMMVMPILHRYLIYTR
jgi:hypothetical protein